MLAKLSSSLSFIFAFCTSFGASRPSPHACPRLPDEDFNKKPIRVEKRPKKPNWLLNSKIKTKHSLWFRYAFVAKKHLNHSTRKSLAFFSKVERTLAWLCTGSQC